MQGLGLEDKKQPSAFAQALPSKWAPSMWLTKTRPYIFQKMQTQLLLLSSMRNEGGHSFVRSSVQSDPGIARAGDHLGLETT